MSNKKQERIKKEFTRLYDILTILRSPEGCPWDREQTPRSFYKNLIEESYEYIDAFLKRDMKECAEELGDMYLVVTMLIIMHEEQNDFNLSDVLRNTSEKLVRRHPHVFEKDSENYDEEYAVENADEVVTLWDSIKENVEGKKNIDNLFTYIPKSMPNILQSLEIQKKVSKVGFDWDKSEDVFDKIGEELDELKLETDRSEADHDRVIEEFGDLMFSMINFARFLEVNPDEALYRANKKFRKRFLTMQRLMDDQGISLETDKPDLATMDRFWETAKKEEK